MLEEWWRSVQVAASELHRHFYGTFLERRLRRKERRLPKFGKVQKKKLKENSELRREITSHCGHSVILGNGDHSGAWLARVRVTFRLSPLRLSSSRGAAGEAIYIMYKYRRSQS